MFNLFIRVELKEKDSETACKEDERGNEKNACIYSVLVHVCVCVCKHVFECVLATGISTKRKHREHHHLKNENQIKIKFTKKCSLFFLITLQLEYPYRERAATPLQTNAKQTRQSVFTLLLLLLYEVIIKRSDLAPGLF